MLNLTGSLLVHGRARGAFDSVAKILDQAFQYDNRVRFPQDFDGYFRLKVLRRFARSWNRRGLDKSRKHGLKRLKSSVHASANIPASVASSAGIGSLSSILQPGA